MAVNAYDAYGIPNTTNLGRFQYTGQIWLPELGLYHYKARAYSPTLGRFLQTDPIGYEDQYNLYAYVGNDPVNKVDPTGEACGLVVGEDGKTDLERRRGRCNDPPGPNLSLLNQPGGRKEGSRTREKRGCGTSSSGTDIARIIGNGLQTAGDIASGVGVGVAFVAPPVGAALITGGRVASGSGTLINITANVIDGNAKGAVQEAASFVGGGAARKGVQKLGNLQFRDARGRFAKNEYGGNKKQKDAKQEAADQIASHTISGGVLCPRR